MSQRDGGRRYCNNITCRNTQLDDDIEHAERNSNGENDDDDDDDDDDNNWKYNIDVVNDCDSAGQ